MNSYTAHRTSTAFEVPELELGSFYEVVEGKLGGLKLVKLDVSIEIIPEVFYVLGGAKVDLRIPQIINSYGVAKKVTRTEFKLLQYMSQHKNVFLSNRRLLAEVWGSEYVDDLQYLRVWVTRLRVKLACKEAIVNSTGIGYKLQVVDGEA